MQVGIVPVPGQDFHVVRHCSLLRPATAVAWQTAPTAVGSSGTGPADVLTLFHVRKVLHNPRQPLAPQCPSFALPASGSPRSRRPYRPVSNTFVPESSTDDAA